MSEASQLRLLRRDATEAAGAATATGRRLGGGRRLILVHGSMDRATSFTRLMGRLRHWDIVAYDRRGYAGSALTGPPATFDDQVDDLLEVLDGEPAVAFGHSFGGDVVLATAAQQPGLIPAAFVWEPPQPWLPWWAEATARRAGETELEPDERAESFMRRMVGDQVWERLPSSTRAQRRREGHTLEAEINSLAVAPVFDPAAIPIPVLVGRGGNSSGHQRRAAAELAEALPAGELVEIAAAGHGAHLSHPAEVARLLEDMAERH
jgi:pimeloyl-ACP methyl ester carboxylesterase